MPATLFYIHDPMCSWCWGFNSAWQSIKKQLPDGVELQTILGGLAPDSNVPMPENTKQFVKENWKNIERVIPGTKFNYDFWSKCKPRRSTYPSCRAVIAARELNPELEFKMISAIQKAYYLQAKNPSDDSVLIALAESIGFDKGEFTRTLKSAAVQKLLKQNLQAFHELASSVGVSGFPSLALNTDKGCRAIPIDYNNPRVSLDAIKAQLA